MVVRVFVPVGFLLHDRFSPFPIFVVLPQTECSPFPIFVVLPQTECRKAVVVYIIIVVRIVIVE